MIRIPTHRPPIHPGEILREDFLELLALTTGELATALGLPGGRLSEIVDGRRDVDLAMARRLARHVGVSTEFWSNLQLRCDACRARGEAGRPRSSG